jgi:hypothetical protein
MFNPTGKIPLSPKSSPPSTSGSKDEALRKLNLSITGQSSPLTVNELSNILRNKDSSTILSLILALENKKLDPNLLLLQSISLARKREDLLPVALAIRYQANPNLYVNIQGLGSLHILGYTYQQLVKLADTPVLNSIIVMLFVSGSKDVLPAISETGGGIRYQETKILSSVPSIQEWLETEGYPSILRMLNDRPGKNYLAKVSPSLLVELGILLDRPDLIDLGEKRLDHLKNNSRTVCGEEDEAIKMDPSWPDVSLEAIIESHSNKVLNNLKAGKHGNSFFLSWPNHRWELIGFESQRNLLPLQLSLKNLNFQAYKFFIQLGYLPDYLFVNQVMIEYQKYKQSKNGAALTAISDMLDESIRTGIRIDPYQYNFFSQIDPSAARRILGEYQEPDWQKICRLQSKLPSDSIENVQELKMKDELTTLAFDLGLPIDQNRKTICQELIKISGDDPDKLNQAAIRRQVNRVSSQVSTPEEYLKGVSTEALLCRNRDLDKLKDKNPYAYNDQDLAFYRGEDGAVWCYTSDEFPDLLTDQINPITQEPLPAKLLEEMKTKQLQVSLAGLEVRDTAHPPPTYQENLKKLRQVDTINNRENERIETSFFKLANSYGVSKEEVSKLTKDQAEYLLRELLKNSEREIELRPFGPSQARMTFIRVSYETLIKNPSSTREFFQLIKITVLGKT